MDANSKILEKIKKLILKQKSAEQIGSLAEAEVFAAKVQEMLVKYNIEKGNIDFSAPDAIGEETMSTMFPTIGGQSAYDIMFPIAKYNLCHLYFIKGADYKMRIIGTPENIDVCKYIFQVIAQALIKICKEEYKKYSGNFEPEWDFSKHKYTKKVGYDTYARAFMRGAGDGLNRKLRVERESLKLKHSQVTGLIVRNDTAVAEYSQKKYKLTTRTSNVTNKETDAYFKGKKAGENMEYTKGLNKSN